MFIQIAKTVVVVLAADAIMRAGKAAYEAVKARRNHA